VFGFAAINYNGYVKGWVRVKIIKVYQKFKPKPIY